MRGDKAYSSRAIRSHLRGHGIEAVIPEPRDEQRHRKRRGSLGGRPISYEPDDYRNRNVIERGFTLVVWSVDRLARSIRDLRDIVAELLAKGVSVRFEKDGLSFAPNERATAAQNLQLNILGVFAEFERDIARERQAEGIVEAKKKGTYRKRKKRWALTAEQIESARERITLGVAVAKVARDLGVARPTLYKALNDETYGSQPDVEAINSELMDEISRVMAQAVEQVNAEVAREVAMG